jgi:hypothetical protein
MQSKASITPAITEPDMTKAVKTKKLLTGLLIDPYKKRVEEVEIEHDLDTWYEALRCQCVDVLCVSSVKEYQRQIDIWFDDEGLLHEPIPPTFRLNAGASQGGHQHILPGYGLVLASDLEGATINLPAKLTPSLFARYSGLAFEGWEDRIPVEACISEVMRSIELELPGRFKYRSEF